MKAICARCGRVTEPAAYIGREAIGPTCARIMGLTAAKSKGTKVRFIGRAPAKEKGPETLDLFANLDVMEPTCSKS